MSIPDGVGLAGVVLILIAYAATALGRMDATKAPALVLNFIGAAMVLYSLAFAFNVSAVVMETAWALIALMGLVRLAFRKKG